MADKLLQDHDGKTSTKRLWGFILLTLGSAMGVALFCMALFKDIVDKTTTAMVFKQFIMFGCALLGLGLVELYRKKQ